MEQAIVVRDDVLTATISVREIAEGHEQVCTTLSGDGWSTVNVVEHDETRDDILAFELADLVDVLLSGDGEGPVRLVLDDREETITFGVSDVMAGWSARCGDHATVGQPTPGMAAARVILRRIEMEG